MTIGIAACGENAGSAVHAGLRAAEAAGHGAIGGFVSFVVIGRDGAIHRAETQRGGSGLLFPGGDIPPIFAEARCAGLMSSGPDRPAPLSQFTPADPEVGLVTGHRFPNSVGVSGRLLNEEVLGLMHAGRSPDEAVKHVLDANPGADAGIIALARDGRVHAANAAYLAQFEDRGIAVLHSADGAAIAAVLHNGIRPYRALATLVAEVAIDLIDPPHRPDAFITLAAGIILLVGPRNALQIDDNGQVSCVTVSQAKFMTGRWSFGVGYQVDVTRHDITVARALYEPYMIVEEGRIVSIDGAGRLILPVRASH